MITVKLLSGKINTLRVASRAAALCFGDITQPEVQEWWAEMSLDGTTADEIRASICRDLKGAVEDLDRMVG